MNRINCIFLTFVFISCSVPKYTENTYFIVRTGVNYEAVVGAYYSYYFVIKPKDFNNIVEEEIKTGEKFFAHQLHIKGGYLVSELSINFENYDQCCRKLNMDSLILSKKNARKPLNKKNIDTSINIDLIRQQLPLTFIVNDTFKYGKIIYKHEIWIMKNPDFCICKPYLEKSLGCDSVAYVISLGEKQDLRVEDSLFIKKTIERYYGANSR